jgi:glycerol-3-phosphate dehydrogenase (NAD(P)+)
MKRIAIIGAGGWGTALSIVTGRAGHHVCLWARRSELSEEINRTRVNSSYLTPYKIPEIVRATSDLSECLHDANIVVLASPSHATRELLLKMQSQTRDEMLFVSATKGIESETGMRVSEILRGTLKHIVAPRFVCLSGPSFAQEVAAGQPTAIVAASGSLDDAREAQEVFSFENLRVYANNDLIGTELGGATKNVIAVAAGMVAGLGFGANTVAALITRGLAEIVRLAVAKKARAETLMGLAGLGDLILTCTGNLSRNRTVGYELGQGKKLEDILGKMNEVAEGVRTTRAVNLLSRRCGIEMPITSEVYSVLYENKSARDAAETLMARPLRDE